MIKLQIIGHLGKDAIVKEINGKSVINFSVAHSEKYKDKDGAAHERTTWVECAYWSDRTALAPYLTKGTIVYAEGSPEADAYLNRDNKATATLRMRVSNIQLLSSKSQQSTSPAVNPVAAARDSMAPVPADQQPEAAADDLPF